MPLPGGAICRMRALPVQRPLDKGPLICKPSLAIEKRAIIKEISNKLLLSSVVFLVSLIFFEGVF